MSGTKSSAIKHGTLTGYQQFHCRCDLCKEARRSYDRNRKEGTAPWRITQRWARGALVSAIMSQKPWICPFGR